MLELHHRVLEAVGTIVRREVVAEVAAHWLAPVAGPPVKAPPARLLPDAPAGSTPVQASQPVAASTPPEKAPPVKPAQLVAASAPPEKALPVKPAPAS
eukprot:3772390-Alexandrium_andersonii.AAC.1